LREIAFSHDDDDDEEEEDDDDEEEEEEEEEEERARILFNSAPSRGVGGRRRHVSVRACRTAGRLFLLAPLDRIVDVVAGKKPLGREALVERAR